MKLDNQCPDCHKEFVHEEDLLDHLIGRHFWSEKTAQDWMHR